MWVKRWGCCSVECPPLYLWSANVFSSRLGDDIQRAGNCCSSCVVTFCETGVRNSGLSVTTISGIFVLSTAPRVLRARTSTGTMGGARRPGDGNRAWLTTNHRVQRAHLVRVDPPVPGGLRARKGPLDHRAPRAIRVARARRVDRLRGRLPRPLPRHPRVVPGAPLPATVPPARQTRRACCR